MKLSRSKQEWEHARREERRRTWPPLIETNHWLQLAEPRDTPDRTLVLKRRIAEIDSLYPADTQVTDPALGARSPKFAPEWPSPPRLNSARDARTWMVSTVCRKRSAASPKVDERAPLGKLLVYEVHGTGWDEASEVVSRGYFDSTDEPGWNTWIDYYEDNDHEIGARLLCYVPPALIDFADAGIAGNPVLCVDWFECTDLITPR